MHWVTSAAAVNNKVVHDCNFCLLTYSLRCVIDISGHRQIAHLSDWLFTGVSASAKLCLCLCIWCIDVVIKKLNIKSDEVDAC